MLIEDKIKRVRYVEYVPAMTFLTEDGVKSTLRINGVKPDLTESEAKALMNTIITKNVFITKSGAFVKGDSAKLTERKVTEFEIA